MNFVVISPERDDPREFAVLSELFAAGLERFHVRKPYASAADLASWLERTPSEWRDRLVLHQHHELAARFGVGGLHWKDTSARDAVGRVIPNPPLQDSCVAAERRIKDNAPYLEQRAVDHTPYLSRSTHTLTTLRAALGHFDSVFFGPVFPSISKPGYGPRDAQVGEALGAILHTRTPAERRTCVIALGGITAENAPRALALGFDGVAVLGALWQAADPVRAFRDIQAACSAARSPLATR